MRHTSATALLASGLLLAGCASSPGAADAEPSSSATSSDAEQTATEPAASTEDTSGEPEPDESTSSPAAAGVDDLFPDPTTLVGATFVDGRDPSGWWYPVVDGTALDLASLGGACFSAGSADVCAYSLHIAVPTWVGDTPQPAPGALLLLLESDGTTDAGDPQWRILDALVAATPDGEPALLELCDGTEGVAVYTDPAGTGPTLTVTAAWGADAAVTSLVELDPESVTCAYLGD